MLRALRNWWRTTGAMHRAYRVERAGGYLEAAELYRALEISIEHQAHPRQSMEHAVVMQKRAQCLLRAGNVEEAGRVLLKLSANAEKDAVLAHVLAAQAEDPAHLLGWLMAELRTALAGHALAAELASAFTGGKAPVGCKEGL